MGSRPNADLFYGYCFSSEHSDNEQLENLSDELWNAEDPVVKIGHYGSSDMPTYYLYVTGTKTSGDWDGPTAVDGEALADPPERWDESLRQFADEHGLTLPDVGGEKSWEDSTTGIGWWLTAEYG